jgi:hypothetical protein
VHADDDAQLVVALNDRTKLTVAQRGDNQTITIAGGVRLSKTGDHAISFVGGTGLDTSGVTDLSGKLVLELGKNADVSLSGSIDPETREVQGGAMLTVRF